MKNSFYVQISSKTLAHYLVGGCICPVSLIERRENDFQNNYSDQIILSTKKWNESSDCSIEVILNSNEEKYIEQLSSEYLLYHSIIPISRIKAIFFSEKEKAEGNVWNLKNGAGFVPERLINYSEKKEEETAQGLPSESISANNNLDELQKALKRFDRLLGGVAFLRTSIFDINDLNINFPIDYFSTLSYFNKTIEKELIEAKVNYNPFLHKIFTGQSNIVKYLAQNIDTSFVEKIAKKEGIQIEEKFGIINLKQIPTNSLTLQLAILNTYGKDKSKSVEDLLNVLFKELETEVKEEIALVYGLYVGYKPLLNYYKLGGRELTVKFKLDSKVDYYIIESLFQYAFYDRTISENFDYLNSILPTKDKASTPVDYKVDYILDETVITKKKDYSEVLKNMLKLITDDIIKWFPADIFKADSNAIEKRLESILKPKFNSLVEEVKFDSAQNLVNENIKKETEKTIKATNDDTNTVDRRKNEVETSYEIDWTVKKEINILELNDSRNNPTADELDSMNKKQLLSHAKKCSIKVPPTMKKEDILKLILSNAFSNNELGL
jgi:hypothetical protein